jgi:hypothetical protein
MIRKKIEADCTKKSIKICKEKTPNLTKIKEKLHENFPENFMEKNKISSWENLNSPKGSHKIFQIAQKFNFHIFRTILL